MPEDGPLPSMGGHEGKSDDTGPKSTAEPWWKLEGVMEQIDNTITALIAENETAAMPQAVKFRTVLERIGRGDYAIGQGFRTIIAQKFMSKRGGGNVKNPTPDPADCPAAIAATREAMGL